MPGFPLAWYQRPGGATYILPDSTILDLIPKEKSP
jgi:hypothetical protein